MALAAKRRKHCRSRLALADAKYMITIMLDPKSLLSDILKLSPEDRLELVDAIWHSLKDAPDDVLLTETQRAELRARYEDYQRNPTAGVPWEEVQQRLENRRR